MTRSITEFRPLAMVSGAAAHGTREDSAEIFRGLAGDGRISKPWGRYSEGGASGDSASRDTEDDEFV